MKQQRQVRRAGEQVAGKTHEELANMDFRAVVDETLGIYCNPAGGFD